MIIQRCLKPEILKRLIPGKAVVIYGPRQVGKTTLVKEILSEVDDQCLFVSGEDRNVHSWLGSQSIDILRENIGNNKLLIIDEAQKIDKIGLNLKLIVDHLDTVKVLATGSSSFELANQVGEPLVGRKWQYNLYPIAQMELNYHEALHQTSALLESRLLYGSYPEVILTNDIALKVQLLNSLIDNYLYRDLLQFNEIKKSQKILDIIKLIAFQIGKDVSLNELGNSVNLDLRTVDKYLDLLEKTFVIRRVYGFSRNLRKEITKNCRFYFYDNGIRNAVVNNFNKIQDRNDIGMLWENYLFMERLKHNHYKHIYSDIYFWRTYDQKEIDLIEERDGKLFGYEFKWQNKKNRLPKLWLETYQNSEYSVVNRENYLKFIT